MNLCDQGGCTARATREVWMDNGYSLWFCGHDAAEAFPLPDDVRFAVEDVVIWA